MFVQPISRLMLMNITGLKVTIAQYILFPNHCYIIQYDIVIVIPKRESNIGNSRFSFEFKTIFYPLIAGPTTASLC